MERSTIFKNGKPSISIRAIEKPWRTVNVTTRGYHPSYHEDPTPCEPGPLARVAARHPQSLPREGGSGLRTLRTLRTKDPQGAGRLQGQLEGLVDYPLVIFLTGLAMI